MAGFAIETERLVLRTWQEQDAPDLLRLRSDPRVMATLGSPQSEGDCIETYRRQSAHQRQHGFCSWVMHSKQAGRLIGTCGLQRAREALPIAGQIEIGWQLEYEYWGLGLAHEAALASLAWGFANLADDAIYAITSIGNSRSQSLMMRLGMEYVAGADFDHPDVRPNDLLLRHVTYVLGRDAWNAR